MSPHPNPLPRGRRGRRWLTLLSDALAVLCLVALVGYVLRDPLTTGRLVIGHDMDQPFNWEAFNRQAFALGQLPLWNPYVFSGYPAQADIQAGVFYPPNWLLRPLLLELGAFFMWNLAMHLVLLGAGTYALCRQVGATARRRCGQYRGDAWRRVHAARLRWTSAIDLRVLLDASSDRIGAPLHAIRPPPATSRPRGHRARSVSRGSHPAIGLRAGADNTDCRSPGSLAGRPSSARSTRHKPIGQLIVLAILVVGLSAFQALPMLRLMQEAGRGGGISFDQATKGSMSLSHLWTILFPNAFGDFRTQFQDGLPEHCGKNARTWAFYSLPPLHSRSSRGIATMCCSLASWRLVHSPSHSAKTCLSTGSITCFSQASGFRHVF